MDYVISKASGLKQLADLKANVLDGGSFALSSADITPNVNTLEADLTLADFTGYAPVTLTVWSAPYLKSNGAAASLSPLAQFNTASPFTVQNLIYCWLILDVDGDLLISGRFPGAPLPMGAAGDHIAALVEYILGNTP